MGRNSRNRCYNSACHLAQFTIGLSFLFISGPVSAVDYDIAQLQAAAEKGHIPQEVELAGAYFAGRGVPQDARIAAYWYQKAAESGDPGAQNEIGFLYQVGIGVPRDPERALHWYQRSAASGFLRAKVNLGVIYLWGIGVPKDESMAVQFFKEAADKGSGIAANYLGEMYYLGIGITQDKNKGESWYTTGVKLHDLVAEFNLGSVFSVEDSRLHDLPKAVKLLRLSATGGYVPAMHSLGLLLTRHPELAKSSKEAVTLLETAANAGSWKSSAVLGIRARDGVGEPRNPEAAYYHFQVAMLQGGETAKEPLAKDLSELIDGLTPEKRAALDSDANAWYKQHHLSLAFVYKDGENEKRFPASALTTSLEGIHAGMLLPAPP